MVDTNSDNGQPHTTARQATLTLEEQKEKMWAKIITPKTDEILKTASDDGQIQWRESLVRRMFPVVQRIIQIREQRSSFVQDARKALAIEALRENQFDTRSPTDEEVNNKIREQQGDPNIEKAVIARLNKAGAAIFAFEIQQKIKSLLQSSEHSEKAHENILIQLEIAIIELPRLMRLATKAIELSKAAEDKKISESQIHDLEKQNAKQVTELRKAYDDMEVQGKEMSDFQLHRHELESRLVSVEAELKTARERVANFDNEREDLDDYRERLEDRECSLHEGELALHQDHERAREMMEELTEKLETMARENEANERSQRSFYDSMRTGDEGHISFLEQQSSAQDQTIERLEIELDALKLERDMALQESQTSQFEIEDIQVEKEREIAAIEADAQRWIAAIESEKQKEISNIKGKQQSEIAAIQDKKQREIAAIQAGSTRKVAEIQAGSTRKVAEIQDKTRKAVERAKEITRREKAARYKTAFKLEAHRHKSASKLDRRDRKVAELTAAIEGLKHQLDFAMIQVRRQKERLDAQTKRFDEEKARHSEEKAKLKEEIANAALKRKRDSDPTRPTRQMRTPQTRKKLPQNSQEQSVTRTGGKVTALTAEQELTDTQRKMLNDVLGIDGWTVTHGTKGEMIDSSPIGPDSDGTAASLRSACFIVSMGRTLGRVTMKAQVRLVKAEGMDDATKADVVLGKPVVFHIAKSKQLDPHTSDVESPSKRKKIGGR